MVRKFAAKPVYYRGTYFRAGLEARWAAVFHEFGERPDYEPEAFRLPSGTYTPDFWLPECDIYVEIKPAFDEGDPDRYKEFVAHTKRPLLFVAGIPAVGKYLLRYFSHTGEDLDKLMLAKFTLHADKIWIVGGFLGLALAHNAKVSHVPRLELDSAVIIACFRRADQNFEKDTGRKAVS